MAEYVAAKGNIARFQTEQDLIIFNAENEYARSIADTSKAIKVGFPSNLTTHVKEGSFYNGEQLICSTDTLKIPGSHNIQNATAAIDAIWQYTQDPAAIKKGLAAFNGLPHRLSFVRTVDSVDYYDDSIATTPGSAIAALRAFNKPKVIILGGSPKGSDFTGLAEEIKGHDVKALLVGEEGAKIAEAFRSAGFENFEFVEGGAKEFVQRAHDVAQPGSVVLLSPSAASFGMFKNYVDRGEQFIAAVQAL